MILQERVKILNTHYYQLINRATNKALYLGSKSQNYQKEKVKLKDPDANSLGQVWQVVRVDPKGFWRKDCFEFVHTRSTLVLTNLEDQFLFAKMFNKTVNNEMQLRFGNWETPQLYYLEHVDDKDFPNIYRFRGFHNTNKPSYVYFDGILKCEYIDPQDPRSHWEVKLCITNDIINRSCYIESAFSGLVMDVPAGSHNEGCRIIQYVLNNRFNQRFNIYKVGRYHKIRNLNSGLFLTAHKNMMEGSEIEQKSQCEDLSQLWLIEYMGKNLYFIRLVANLSFHMGIRELSTKVEDRIILTKKEDYGYWKIIGFIPH